MDTTVVVAIIGGLLGGTAVAALINQIGETIRQKSKRKADAEISENKDIAALKTALKWVMYDRIRYLGQVYIGAKEIDFDDRRILNEMHHCYHNGLGGNGDLDTLMKEVNALPLK
jgi:hypothetical protein